MTVQNQQAPTTDHNSSNAHPASPAGGTVPSANPQHDNSTNGAASAASSDSIPEWMQTAQLFLEDFIVTMLLRQGKSLKSGDLAAAAGEASPSFHLSRALLQAELPADRLVQTDREWDLATRVSRKGQNREERERQPMESTIQELLRNIGKPLPVPVIAREVALMRGSSAPNIREVVGQVLSSAFWAVETAPNTWIHESFVLETGAGREELILRENRLTDEPMLQNLGSLPPATGGLKERLVGRLKAAARPLPIKVLSFLLWKQDPTHYDSGAVLATLSDRATFYSFIGGYVTLQSQMPLWRDALQSWNQELSEHNGPAVDVAALLRHRLAPGQTITPDPQEIDDMKQYGRSLGTGQAISLAVAIPEVLGMDPQDEDFVPILQGLNDAMRRSPEFLPVGIGRFLLRESVPAYVGEVPVELRPVQLSVRDPETDEPLDFEMSDEGLEGDAAEFVHSPQWEDVNEEVEVKLPRRTGLETAKSTRYVVLNPHHQAGTLKLRRMDEDFFAVEGGLARITVRVEEEGRTRELQGWASRESGLIYGLGDWFKPRTPESGGVLEFTRSDAPGSALTLTIGAPDKLTLIEGSRAEDLIRMREASPYTSLFDLLQTIMSNHQQGAELPTLWAEVNMVRRTTKRLICSVLSGYHCYYFKQRGPKQILWRFDAGKLDQGFKRNKRKYVRR